MLIDSHCHIDFDVFDRDRDALLQACVCEGVEQLLVPAVRRADWRDLYQLAKRYPMIKPAYGLHPLFMQDHSDTDVRELAHFLDHHEAIAVGEIGLDFYEASPENLESRDRQRLLFEEQVRVAINYDLPLILHVRKAHDEVSKILTDLQFSRGGIVHAFSGSEQQAMRYIEQGFALGFGGAVTYERARKIRRLATILPLEHLVLETDAPDMKPAFAEDDRNTPLSVVGIAQCIAQLRGIEPRALAKATSENVERIMASTAL